jgi:GrpB-like predicted nucleotidyltransferase (UPF0157 family)
LGPPAVEHVGSTAVPGLAAKPVLDILVGVETSPLPEDQLGALAALGYEYRGDGGVTDEQFFRTNPRTRHLRVVQFGTAGWQKRLVFRDYLRDHPDAAREYATLKQNLVCDHREARDSYTEGKSSFIEAILKKAEAER